MNDQNENPGFDSLILRSELSEIARVPPWVEKLAAQHEISERTQFAMDLCLEEAVSNVIRHGYAGEPDHAVTVRCETRPNGSIALVVEDDAAPFNPLLVREPVLSNSIAEVTVGGQGIHLLKQFADAVEYEQKPTGNRLTLRFLRSASSSKNTALPPS
jgi:anti-sigma regulatory factor (Ser/Thr protein kinase)